MADMADGPLNRYFEVASSSGVYPNAGNLRFYLGQIYGDTALAGRRLLDIGAGNGLFGLYAACVGAREVLCLEPEAAGSTAGVRKQFDFLVESIGLRNVTMSAETFQALEGSVEPFDVILMHNCVNHLSEEACIRLHQDESAKDTYRGLFGKLHGLMSPGGTLIMADAARRNFFADCGWRNPIAPMIEWHKHQSPRLWAGLLAEAGFAEPVIRWTSLNSFRWPGRLLMGNRVAAYFLASHFCLRMHKR